MKQLVYLLLASAVLIFSNCQSKTFPGSIDHIQNVTSLVDDDILLTATVNGQNWLSYGGDYTEDRFSPVELINKNNILAFSLWY